MRKVCGLGLVLVLVAGFTIQVCAQKNSPSPSADPLVLTGTIPLPNVKGRIDHFGLDSTHNRLVVSALGNNTDEIIGIGAQTVVHNDFWGANATTRGVFVQPSIETNIASVPT